MLLLISDFKVFLHLIFHLTCLRCFTSYSLLGSLLKICQGLSLNFRRQKTVFTLTVVSHVILSHNLFLNLSTTCHYLHDIVLTYFNISPLCNCKFVLIGSPLYPQCLLMFWHIVGS